MKRVLIGIIVSILILLNGFAIFALLDTYVFSKKAETEVSSENGQDNSKEENKTESKSDGTQNTTENKDITIGIPEEVLKEREAAQKAYEDARAEAEEKMTISDDFSEKLDDLSNPMIDHDTIDFSEFIIKDIVDGKIIASKTGESLYGVMDMEKNEILPFKYENISFSKDGFYVVKEAGKMGILDEDGLEIVDNTYDSISELISGYFLAKSMTPDGKTTSKIFNRNSDLVFSVDMNIISVFEENTNYFKFESNGKFGIVDINGDERLKPEYDELILKNGKFYFKQGTEIGTL